MMWLMGLVALSVAQQPGPYVVSVGVNLPAIPALAPLQYADDDAAAAVSLYPTVSESWLLTVMDEQTQEQYPELAPKARPPTLAELRRVVGELGARLEADRSAGRQPVVILWLVGHGQAEQGMEPRFAMADGFLTASMLDQEIIKPLAVAHRVHVVLDACHAAALVGARAFAAQASVGEAEQAWRMNRVVYPQVGFLFATSPASRTYEWQRIRSGVFSALVRFALRGAGDVNLDGRVTYDEVAAFVASAVQSVPNPEARPRVQSRPPDVDRNSPLSEGHWFADNPVLMPATELTGPFHVEDLQGRWLMAARLEPAFTPRLWLPSSARALVHDGGGMVQSLTVQDGVLVKVSPPVPVGSQDRGVLDDALKQGMFGTPYGPSYFKGFMGSRMMDADPVPSVPLATQPTQTRPLWRTVMPLASVPLVCIGLILAGLSLPSGLMAIEGSVSFANTNVEREAALAAGRAVTGGGVGGMLMVGGVVSLGLAGVVLVASLLLR